MEEAARGSEREDRGENGEEEEERDEEEEGARAGEAAGERRRGSGGDISKKKEETNEKKVDRGERRIEEFRGMWGKERGVGRDRLREDD